MNSNLQMKEIFSKKRILITGNTGFKGSWLTAILQKFGAQVAGFSMKPKTSPSMFELLMQKNTIDQTFGDISIYDQVLSKVKEFKPDFIFHLAAESLVSVAYESPLKTYLTNSLGTANLLEVLRVTDYSGIVIFITSDKCYENDGRLNGYKEDDRLGGIDPYSASKASAELIISSYYRSFFKQPSKTLIGVARAGNVIGGGDWNKNRIIVDCIKAWSSNQEIVIRNPHSTRPWQHVLEPLNGYLKLACAIKNNPDLSGVPFNFGPKLSASLTVFELVNKFAEIWKDEYSYSTLKINQKELYPEENFLALDSSRAEFELGWKCKLDITETLKLTHDWYKTFFNNSKKIEEITDLQIESYFKL